MLRYARDTAEADVLIVRAVPHCAAAARRRAARAAAGESADDATVARAFGAEFDACAKGAKLLAARSALIGDISGPGALEGSRARTGLARCARADWLDDAALGGYGRYAGAGGYARALVLDDTVAVRADAPDVLSRAPALALAGVVEDWRVRPPSDAAALVELSLSLIHI